MNVSVFDDGAAVAQAVAFLGTRPRGEMIVRQGGELIEKNAARILHETIEANKAARLIRFDTKASTNAKGLPENTWAHFAKCPFFSLAFALMRNLSSFLLQDHRLVCQFRRVFRDGCFPEGCKKPGFIVLSDGLGAVFPCCEGEICHFGKALDFFLLMGFSRVWLYPLIAWLSIVVHTLYFQWLNDQSRDWLMDWMNEWLIECLIDWLMDGLIEWLMDWLIDWLNEYMHAWINAWWIKGQIDWLIDWSFDWSIERLY